MITAISPCLWFDGNGEEAARFYVDLFPNSRIDAIARSPTDRPGGTAGDVLTVAFTLAGRSFTALNGGPMFTFNEAISMQAICETQDEIDRLWSALSANPDAEMCGWCKDRYGLSWQIVPARMNEWMADPAVAARVFAKIMAPMKKIDIATLETAARG
ncbi:VOC family protein [Sphingobium subterraneum]|uniref:Putative 3-demethylubiquinone-9 3-methyltransferase (Glyoxalase superfamily) n=1 Tax=Sphingobium subterraneum TaxID=627688 RepID=A0A841J8W1_9SPHN|nr:VOC family protein [Sphingobium subterraneum]MBB6124978.1 putative 3-demethylubiquinone-9 3-methyltransferase (glyoxalase superfamily) [Sphingobium subterraneum]